MDEEQSTKDYFPTSARPIFLRIFLLVLVVIAICVYVSMEPEVHDDTKNIEATPR